MIELFRLLKPSAWPELTLAEPLALIALLLIPLLIWWHVRAEPTRLRFSVVRREATYPRTLRQRLLWLPTALEVLGLALLVAAIAQPQSSEYTDDSVEGIDIMLALDMSGSMNAVDMTAREIVSYQRRHSENPPSRFENAISTLQRFVEERSRDRIGMVIFARDAYVQFPLTLDYSTVQTILSRLEMESINPNATAIGNAVGLSVRGLVDSHAESRAIILITDGKQQGGNISPTEAASIARDEGIRVYPILVGSGGNTMAPTGVPRATGLMRYTPESYPIDADLLEEIADSTGGAFYRASQPHQLRDGLQEILNELETTSLQDVKSVRNTELYPVFALLALLSLLLSGVLRISWLRRIA